MTIKIRGQKISIDLPTEDAEPYAQVVVQKVVKNDRYVTTQLIDRWANTGRFVGDFALQTATIVDPITGANITISGLGATMLIKAIVSQWLAADYQGQINDVGDVIIEE